MSCTDAGRGPQRAPELPRGRTPCAPTAQGDGGAAAPGAVPAGASVDAFSGALNPRYVPELMPIRPSSVALNCGISRFLYTEAMKITPRISVQANIWKRWMLMPVGSLSTSRRKPSLFSVVGGVGLF